jgi:hypothetical protein
MSEGYIEEITPGQHDGMVTAWGSFDDGETFDIPLSKEFFYEVGDAVLMRYADGEEHVACDRVYIVMGKHYASLLYCAESLDGEGYEIVAEQHVVKTPSMQN